MKTEEANDEIYVITDDVIYIYRSCEAEDFWKYFLTEEEKKKE